MSHPKIDRKKIEPAERRLSKALDKIAPYSKGRSTSSPPPIEKWVNSKDALAGKSFTSLY